MSAKTVLKNGKGWLQVILVLASMIFFAGGLNAKVENHSARMDGIESELQHISKRQDRMIELLLIIKEDGK